MFDAPETADSAALQACVNAGFYTKAAEAAIRKLDAETELAENLAKEQHFKTSIWALKWEQERIALDAQKDALQRSKQLKRPCMTLGIMVTQEERGDRTVFIANWGGLVAEGDTPEMACSNFDRMWVGGTDEL